MKRMLQRGVGLWLITMIALLLITPLPPVAQSQSPTLQRIESDDPAVTQIGNWTSQAASQTSGGNYLYSGGADTDVLSLQFSGASIEVLYVAGPSLGILAIEVDGTVLRTVITTADETAYQQSAQIDYLSDEAHTLKVYAQAGGVVAVDAFFTAIPTSGQTEEERVGPRVPCNNDPVQRVSVATGGAQGNSTNSFFVERDTLGISDDGRFVAFASDASNLVPDDTNGSRDVFVHDRQNCETIRVSVSNSNQQGASHSYGPKISGNGRYVLFYSLAHLTSEGLAGAFIYDLQIHQISRLPYECTQGISSDGRYVLCVLSDMQVYVYDRQNSVLNRVSQSMDGQPANDISLQAAFSADGNIVIFASLASNLVEVTNYSVDAYVRDMTAGVTTRISLDAAGNPIPISASEDPSMSADGRYAVFSHQSDSLIVTDNNGLTDIFVYDRQTAEIALISVNSDEVVGNGGSGNPYPYSGTSISADGRYVAFPSGATNLVPSDTNDLQDIFVRDRQLGTTRRVSVGMAGGQANAPTYVSRISANGRYVAFASSASNLVNGDTNGGVDVFVIDLQGFFGGSDLSATPLDNGRIQLNWMDNASDETEYRIERSPDGLNNWVEIGVAPADTTTYTNVSLICNTTYHYRVRAYRASDATYSAYSNVANATTSACPTNCQQTRGTTQAIPITSDGTPSDAGAGFPALSTDGRYVAFASAATDLVSNDTNGFVDIFVKDRQTCQVWRVSVASDGTQANGFSYFSAISGDGRYIAFDTQATNLVEGDTNAHGDVMLHDRFTGQTTRVSVSSAEQQGDGDSRLPVISADGRYVAFISRAQNLVTPDANGDVDDIYVRDTLLGTTTLVSVNSAGIQANGLSTVAGISGDGSVIVFESTASNLVMNDTNGRQDIFVHYLSTGQTIRASVSSTSVQANHDSNDPAISANGRYVVFYSYASNLVPADTDSGFDTFVRDLLTNETFQVSIRSDGSQADGSSLYSRPPAISNDGRFVVFESEVATLVDGDTNGRRDIFVHNRQIGQTRRISTSGIGIQSNGHSSEPVISADGRYAVFSSAATNLLPDGTDGSSRLFLVNLDSLFTPDALAIINPATRSANLIHTLTNPPAGGDYTQFATGFPYGAGGQYLTGDWNGDGLETLGVYRGGAFFFTNDYGTGGTWGGVWFGLGGQPVAGRFDANVGHDCLGVTDSGAWTNGDLYFALYFTCNLTSGPTSPLTFQWLSIILPNSQGFTGTYQFVAGDFDGDGLDSIAIRRGNFIAWTNVPPTTVYSAFQYAQYIGAPGTGDEGKIVVGDWDLNNTDSFGLVYQNGTFYRRNDLDWNSGAYTLQQFTPLVGTPFDVASWRPH